MVAWLAGIIDGEGTVGLLVNERSAKEAGRRKTIRTIPRVIIANTDQGIIDQCLKALSLIGVGKYVRTERSTNRTGWHKKTSYKPVTIIEVSGFMRLYRLLTAVTPYLAGDKRRRAEILLRFITARMQRAEGLKRASNLSYNEEDKGNILAFLALTKSKRTAHVAKILNEHTRGAERASARL